MGDPRRAVVYNDATTEPPVHHSGGRHVSTLGVLTSSTAGSPTLTPTADPDTSRWNELWTQPWAATITVRAHSSTATGVMTKRSGLLLEARLPAAPTRKNGATAQAAAPRRPWPAPS